jgi:hypothetical protein
MNYLLFHADGPAGERPFDWAWIDKWAGLYGFQPVIVDLEGAYKQKDQPPFFFRTLHEAVSHDAFALNTFLWLDPYATDRIWDLEIPQDNLVLCVGHDIHGFGGVAYPGIRARIDFPRHDTGAQFHAAMVVPIALFEVMT